MFFFRNQIYPKVYISYKLILLVNFDRFQLCIRDCFCFNYQLEISFRQKKGDGFPHFLTTACLISHYTSMYYKIHPFL